MSKSLTNSPMTQSFSRDKLKEMALSEGMPGQPQKKHYEFWGNIVSSYNIARLIIIILSLLCLGLFVLVFVYVNKPPTVIRVDSTGKDASEASFNADSVFNEELIFNTRTFIEKHTDLSPITVESSLEGALAMCATQARKALLEEIKANDYIGTARKYSPTCTIDIGNIEVKKREHPYYDTYCVINVNFIKPKAFLRVHTYSITWKKVNRSNANPSGLYIVKLDHYDQGDIKKPLN